MPFSRRTALIVFLMVAGAGVQPTARACLRATLDDRAVQWSTGIVEATLESIGRPTPLEAKPSAGAGSAGAGGKAVAERFEIYKFAVTRSLDGQLRTGDTLRVIRFIAREAPASKCPLTLKDKRAGERFVLLLREVERSSVPAPQDAIAPGTRADTHVVVHLLKRDEMDDGAIDDLKKLIDDVRAAQAAATADAVNAQATALALAQDAVEAEEAEKALLKMGPPALESLQLKLADPETPADGRTRLQRVIAELTPPVAPIEADDEQSPSSAPGPAR